MKSLVSVILPAYNAEKYIVQSIRSVLDQGYPNLEILVMDDGSTDRTAERVKSIGDARVKFLTGLHKGNYFARNRGLLEARGEFIAFLDADDLWAPGKLEKQLRVLDQNPDVDFCCTGEAIFFGDDQSQFYREKHSRFPVSSHDQNEFVTKLLTSNFVMTSSVLMRRRVFEQVGFFDTEFQNAMDYDYWLRIALSHGVYYLPDRLALKREHGANISRNRVHSLEADMYSLEKVLRQKAQSRFFSPGMERVVERHKTKLQYQVGVEALAVSQFEKAEHYLKQAHYEEKRKFTRLALWIARCRSNFLVHLVNRYKLKKKKLGIVRIVENVPAKKIRVLHLIKTLNLGGAEANLFNLAMAIDPDRFEVHVGYSSGGELEARFRGRVKKLFRYARRPHRIKSLATAWIVLRIAFYVLRHRIDVIHTHTFNAHVWGSMAAKITGSKVVEHVHDFRYLEDAEFRRRRGTATQYKFAKLFNKFSDAVVVLTEDNVRFLRQHCRQLNGKVRKIWNGIPAFIKERGNGSARVQLRKKWNIPADAPVIFTSARIAPEKNIDLIFCIAERVLLKEPKAVFMIAGDGPLYDLFRALSKQLGIEKNVRMIGFSPDTVQLLGISDLYLLPSFLELHSIGVLEAMSMGLPVVTSSGVGSNDEFIKNWENGVLLDPFSGEQWADAIVRLIEDKDLREEIGRNAYNTCMRLFDIKEQTRKIERIYEEISLQ